LIGTAPTGTWNLIEIYERELKLRDISLEDGLKHLIFIDNPQSLTDQDINILYNVSDVGLNTAMGEGWGLCNFEAGAVGVPQIVPEIGGFLDFYSKECATLIKPKIHIYTDMTTDGCPGCAQICDPLDFADAIDRYYADDDLRKEHGEGARKRILTNYKWSNIGEKLYDQIVGLVAPAPAPATATAAPTATPTKVSLDQLELAAEKLKEPKSKNTLREKLLKKRAQVDKLLKDNQAK
jgi:glycosyltransferase involved in cell wall biosynthesis